MNPINLRGGGLSLSLSRELSSRVAVSLIYCAATLLGLAAISPYALAQSESDTARVSIRVGKTVHIAVSGVENVNGRAQFVEVKNRATGAVTELGPFYTDGEGKADADLSGAMTGGGVFLIKARDAASGVESATMSLAISLLELSLAPPAVAQGHTAQARATLSAENAVNRNLTFVIRDANDTEIETTPLTTNEEGVVEHEFAANLPVGVYSAQVVDTDSGARSAPTRFYVAGFEVTLDAQNISPSNPDAVEWTSTHANVTANGAVGPLEIRIRDAEGNIVESHPASEWEQYFGDGTPDRSGRARIGLQLFAPGAYSVTVADTFLNVESEPVILNVVETTLTLTLDHPAIETTQGVTATAAITGPDNAAERPLTFKVLDGAGNELWQYTTTFNGGFEHFVGGLTPGRYTFQVADNAAGTVADATLEVWQFSVSASPVVVFAGHLVNVEVTAQCPTSPAVAPRAMHWRVVGTALDGDVEVPDGESGFQIDTSGLPPGEYQVELSDDGLQFTTTATFWVMALSVTAGDAEIVAGERTTAHIELLGLDTFPEGIYLRLEAEGPDQTVITLWEEWGVTNSRDLADIGGELLDRFPTGDYILRVVAPDLELIGETAALAVLPPVVEIGFDKLSMLPANFGTTDSVNVFVQVLRPDNERKFSRELEIFVRRLNDNWESAPQSHWTDWWSGALGLNYPADSLEVGEYRVIVRDVLTQTETESEDAFVVAQPSLAVAPPRVVRGELVAATVELAGPLNPQPIEVWVEDADDPTRTWEPRSVLSGGAVNIPTSGLGTGTFLVHAKFTVPGDGGAGVPACEYILTGAFEVFAGALEVNPADLVVGRGEQRLFSAEFLFPIPAEPIVRVDWLLDPTNVTTVTAQFANTPDPAVAENTPQATIRGLEFGTMTLQLDVTTQNTISNEGTPTTDQHTTTHNLTVWTVEIGTLTASVANGGTGVPACDPVESLGHPNTETVEPPVLVTVAGAVIDFAVFRKPSDAPTWGSTGPNWVVLQQPPGAWTTFTETGTDAVAIGPLLVGGTYQIAAVHWDSIAVVDVFVQGIAAVNAVPQTVLAGNPVTLTATLMMPDNPAPATFEWVIISAPDEPDMWMDDPATLTTTFFAWTPGYYTLEARAHPDYENHELLHPVTYRLTLLVEWIAAEFERFDTQQGQGIPVTISLLPAQSRSLRVEILDAFAAEETVVSTSWYGTDGDGLLALNLFGDLSPGEYRLRITDETDPDYVQIISWEWATVIAGSNVSVTMEPDVIAIGESAEARVTIAFGEPDPETGIPTRGLPGREVVVTVTNYANNTGTYSGVTDSDGIARIPVGFDLDTASYSVWATDEATGASSSPVTLKILTMATMQVTAPELSAETTAYRQQPPPSALRVRASEALQLAVTPSLAGETMPEGLPQWSCDPPAAGTFTFNSGMETAFYVADPMWRGTLTITARVGSETLTAHIIYIGVHHVESSSQTAWAGDTVTFTAYPDPQNESFPLDVTGDSAVRWTSQPDLGAPTVTVYGDRVEASYIIPEGVSGSGGSGGGGLTFVDATAKAEVAADSAFDAGSGDFSVVTFFKSSVPPPDHHVVFSNQNAQHPSTLELYVDINAADMRVAAGNPMSYQVFNHGGAPFDGQWHSVIITRQNGLLTAYYDGVNVGSGMAGGDGQHGQLSFGHLWGENHAQTLIGSLKNYSYWNRALSAQEVAAIASGGGGLAGNESGLVAYWPMDDGSGATLREVVAGRDAVLSGNYQWQSGGGGTNGLVEVKATSGSSEGKAFVMVVEGEQWVITPQPAVVGQDDVLAMSATQDGVTGMGAWMTKADFDLLWEIFSMTLAQSDTVTARQMLSAMFDEPNLTPPPLVAQLVTEGLPLLRVTVTDWDWMAAVEELIINGQTVDTSGWYPEDWEELLTQPHVQEMVLVLTENQEVVVERTIRAVMSDTGAEWHGVNTGSVDVVFFPMQEIAEVFASVSSTLTHHNESGIRGSCDSYPEWTLAEATLWVVNVGRVLAKNWVTGQTAETVRDPVTNQSGPLGVLTTGVGGYVTLQAFINPPNAPSWPADKPYWELVNAPTNSAAQFTETSGVALTRFGPMNVAEDHLVRVSSSPDLTVLMVPVDKLRLDGDGDHNGTVDGTEEEREKKNKLPGVIVLNNVDDDNGNGIPDNEGDDANTVNRGEGHNDFDDFAPIVLRKLKVPDGWSLRLRLHTPKNVADGVSEDKVVRIFSARANGATPILGPRTAQFVLPADEDHNVDLARLAQEDIELGVEGLQFAAEVKLVAELTDQNGKVFDSDEIQLKVAPLILLHHLDNVEVAYISRSKINCENNDPDPVKEAYITAFAEKVQGVNIERIHPDLCGRCVNNKWSPVLYVQDYFQIGFQVAPYGKMHVVLTTEPDTTLTPFLNTLLRPSTGIVKVGGNGTAFGNVEVSPRCKVGNINYPFGRIYYGTGIHDELRDFLKRQKVQDPVTFDTSWLGVGHVDELMSIIPCPNTAQGWKVLIASPRRAAAILGDPTNREIPIPKYREQNIPSGNRFNKMHDLLTKPTLKGERSRHRDIWEFNLLELDPVIFRIKQNIRKAFGLNDADFINVPVLFDEGSSGLAMSITPNLVNGYFFPSVQKFVTAKCFLTNAQMQNDPFEADFTKKLQNTGVTAEFVDTWFFHSFWTGGVHCAANSRRKMPEGEAAKWWKLKP